MDVRNPELIEEVIDTIHSWLLDEVVQQCYAFEAARHTRFAIVSPHRRLRATFVVNPKLPGEPQRQEGSVKSLRNQTKQGFKCSGIRQVNSASLASPASIVTDAGADEMIIIPEHFTSLGLSVSDLNPPPDNPRHIAGGSPIMAHNGWTSDRFSCKTSLMAFCLTHAPRRASSSSSSATAFPFSNTTTPAKARAHFPKEQNDVLMMKGGHDSTLRSITRPPMVIHQWEEVHPFASHTPRQIPLAFKKEVKPELVAMVAEGIIALAREDPSPRCHLLFTVAKSKGKVRITTDFFKLNRQVSHPEHPSPTPFASIRTVDSKGRCYTTVNALCGYYQLELVEQDQPLSCPTATISTCAVL
ncbi:hypothetical protein O3P69_014938 [Scylla paramamosain]|uniref:Uncharacterized protein n=1 Tax=Scylla paramamosain TaxID=85552 RepID=A0AAW0TYR9_SCYPA